MLQEITWMWSRHESGDSTSEGGSSELEEIERKDRPKRRVCIPHNLQRQDLSTPMHQPTNQSIGLSFYTPPTKSMLSQYYQNSAQTLLTMEASIILSSYPCLTTSPPSLSKGSISLPRPTNWSTDDPFNSLPLFAPPRASQWGNPLPNFS